MPDRVNLLICFSPPFWDLADQLETNLPASLEAGCSYMEKYSDIWAIPKVQETSRTWICDGILSQWSDQPCSGLGPLLGKIIIRDFTAHAVGVRVTCSWKHANEYRGKLVHLQASCQGFLQSKCDWSHPSEVSSPNSFAKCVLNLALSPPRCCLSTFYCSVSGETL